MSKLTLDQQVKWLRAAQQSGALEKLGDAQLVALFQLLDPLALPRYIKEGPNGYPSYEFTMSRSEMFQGTTVWTALKCASLIFRKRSRQSALGVRK